MSSSQNQNQDQNPNSDPINPSLVSDPDQTFPTVPQQQNQSYGSEGLVEPFNPLEAPFDSHNAGGYPNSAGNMPQAYPATVPIIQEGLQGFTGQNNPGYDLPLQAEVPFYPGQLVPHNAGGSYSLQPYSGTPGIQDQHLQEFTGLNRPGIDIPLQAQDPFYPGQNSSAAVQPNAEFTGQMNHSPMNSAGYTNRQLNSSFHLSGVQDGRFNTSPLLQSPLNLPGYPFNSQSYMPQGPFHGSGFQQNHAFNGHLQQAPQTNQQQQLDHQEAAGFNFGQLDQAALSGYQQQRGMMQYTYLPPGLQQPPSMTNQQHYMPPQNNNSYYSRELLQQPSNDQPRFRYIVTPLPPPPHVLSNENDQLFVRPEPSIFPKTKPRLRWTPELHTRFMNAVKELGGLYKATPKSILKRMNVYGLSMDNLKSHLQKMRIKQGGKVITPAAEEKDDDDAYIPPLSDGDQLEDWLPHNRDDNDDENSGGDALQVT